MSAREVDDRPGQAAQVVDDQGTGFALGDLPQRVGQAWPFEAAAGLAVGDDLHELASRACSLAASIA